MTPQPKPYGAKNNCVRAARKALGDDAMENRDFTVHQDGRGWTWTAMPKAAGKAKAAPKPMGKGEALEFGKAAHVAMLEGATPEEAITAAAAKVGVAKAKGRGRVKVQSTGSVHVVPGGTPMRLTKAAKAELERRGGGKDMHAMDNAKYPEDAPASRRVRAARKATGMTAAEAKELEGAVLGSKHPHGAANPGTGMDTATKTAVFVQMIERADGANSAQLEAATGWKAPSVRGLLGAWRAKGAEISATKEGEPSRVVYRMTKRPVGINIASKGHQAAPAPAAEEAVEEVI